MPGQQRDATAFMTPGCESHSEASRPKPLLGPKETLKIGCWNVRTMFEPSKAAQIAREMEQHNICILGISEARWTGSGRITLNRGQTVLYSGRGDNQHQDGVALMLNKEASKALLEWNPVSSRILTARFDSRFVKLSIIQCYAPTNEAEEETKDTFYEQLQSVVDKVPKHDLLLVMGDVNAKVGCNNQGRESFMGRFGKGEMNENGELFADFCGLNNLVIGGTILPHKNIQKNTWVSPDRRTNQIDHVTINKRWRSSLLRHQSVQGSRYG